jgi:hypothetical protein
MEPLLLPRATVRLKERVLFRVLQRLRTLELRRTPAQPKETLLPKEPVLL